MLFEQFQQTGGLLAQSKRQLVYCHFHRIRRAFCTLIIVFFRCQILTQSSFSFPNGLMKNKYRKKRELESNWNAALPVCSGDHFRELRMGYNKNLVGKQLKSYRTVMTFEPKVPRFIPSRSVRTLYKVGYLNYRLVN